MSMYNVIVCTCVCVCVEEGVRDLVGMWIADRCVCGRGCEGFGGYVDS